jgi:hypothetical protein
MSGDLPLADQPPTPWKSGMREPLLTGTVTMLLYRYSTERGSMTMDPYVVLAELYQTSLRDSVAFSALPHAPIAAAAPVRRRSVRSLAHALFALVRRQSPRGRRSRTEARQSAGCVGV